MIDTVIFGKHVRNPDRQAKQYNINGGEFGINSEIQFEKHLKKIHKAKLRFISWHKKKGKKVSDRALANYLKFFEPLWYFTP